MQKVLSTRNLFSLPGIAEMIRILKSMAMLDAIIEPEWQYRYYSFDSKWAENEMMASMRNGSGDMWFILFCKEGAIWKGFNHESEMTPYGREPVSVWPGVLNEVPNVFEKNFLNEPAFTMKDTTFCIWRLHSQSEWMKGSIEFPNCDDPDGSEHLLGLIPLTAKDYRTWAEDYYERDLDLGSIESVYAHVPLNTDIIEALNYEVSITDLKEDIAGIGYPLSNEGHT